MDGEKKKAKLSFGYLILGLWAVLLVQQLLSAYLRPTRISYSDFKVAVAQGKVEEAAIGKTLIQGRMKDAPSVPEAVQSQPQQPKQQPQAQQQQEQSQQQPVQQQQSKGDCLDSDSHDDSKSERLPGS